MSFFDQVQKRKSILFAPLCFVLSIVFLSPDMIFADTNTSEVTNQKSASDGSGGGITWSNPDAMEKIKIDNDLLTSLKTNVDNANLTVDLSVIEVVEEARACEKSVARGVEGVCNPSNNPGLAAAGDAVSSMSTAFNAAGVFDACSSMGKALKAASTATVGFKASCGAVYLLCTNHCDSSNEKIKTKIDEIDAKITQQQKALEFLAGPGQGSNSAIQQKKQTIEYLNSAKTDLQELKDIAINKKLKVGCEQFKGNIDKAAMDLAGLANSYHNTQRCKEQTASNTDNSIDCSNSANAHLVTCICQANPADPACNSSGSSKATPGGGLALGGAPANTGLGKDTDLSQKIQDDMNNFGSDGPSGPMGPSAPNSKGTSAKTASLGGGGGSGALGGSGGGSGSYGSSSGGRNASTLKKRVVSGFVGGSRGGGGGGYRSSYGSTGGNYGNYSKKRGGLNLKDYLPGGKKYKRGIAGVKEISAANGPTIWEKVSIQYQRSKGTLK